MNPPAETERVLAGRVVAIPETRQADVLANLLERRGARVLRCPLVGIQDSPDAAAVNAWVERRISLPTDLIVFYTGEGIERLVGFARRAGREEQFLAALRRTPKLTRGPKPKRALHRLGLETEHEATEPTTAGLLAVAERVPLPNGRVALQLYNVVQDRELEKMLLGRGSEVDCIAPYVYATAAEDERVEQLIAELAAGHVDALAFTSSSQVQRLVGVARKRRMESALRSGLARTRIAAVGPVVAAQLVADGIRVDAMPEHSYSMKPLVTSVCEMLSRAG
ncbi:MAG TPA: uroporphyrinogen-III synthase [Gammaproteobacteria bacterium]|nr:uroporphyrinogen-III synthase [Gammaproteobacteria bacterium]